MKTLFIFLMSTSLVFSQTKQPYSQFEGKVSKLLYTQITENQAFCTYEDVEKTEKPDMLWEDIYKVEILKYNPIDSVKIIPLHKFSYEKSQQKFAYIKYKVELKNKRTLYLIKNFTQPLNELWIENKNLDQKEKSLSWIFSHIKTEVFQQIYSKDDIANEPEINKLKKKVLSDDGYVNFEDLFSQLKQVEKLPAFKKLCN
jgi:hypothetical protein